MISRYTAAGVVLAMLALSGSPARADQYPTLNVTQVCHGITDQSELQEGLRSVTFDECVKAEQGDRETMIKEWSTFSSSDRTLCIAEATMGGESSYTDLLTCLEMARDVRALHKQTDDQKQTSDQPQQYELFLSAQTKAQTSNVIGAAIDTMPLLWLWHKSESCEQLSEFRY